MSRAASLPDLEIALRAKAGKRQEHEGAGARPDGFGLIQSAELLFCNVHDAGGPDSADAPISGSGTSSRLTVCDNQQNGRRWAV